MWATDTANVKSEKHEQKSDIIVHLLQPPPHTRYWKPTAMDATLKMICAGTPAVVQRYWARRSVLNIICWLSWAIGRQFRERGRENWDPQ